MPENTTVGYVILQAMREKGWSLRDVEKKALELDKPFSYEHLRKIIKGTTNPSLDLLSRIAKVLKIDVKELTRLQVESSVSRQYGREFLKSMNISPEVYELDKLLKMLKPGQREPVMMMIRSLVQGNTTNGTLTLRKPTRRRRA